MNASKEKITFYKEWLCLDKKEFRILAMLAEMGNFRGILKDICKYLSLSAQSNSYKPLRESIEILTDSGFITSQKNGNTYVLSIIPKDEIIEMPQNWFRLLRTKKYTADSVAWEQVAKLYLWISDLPRDIVITNNMIVNELNLSESVIGSAKKVLDEDFEAIIRGQASEKTGDDSFRTIGHRIETTAW